MKEKNKRAPSQSNDEIHFEKSGNKDNVSMKTIISTYDLSPVGFDYDQEFRSWMTSFLYEINNPSIRQNIDLEFLSYIDL